MLRDAIEKMLESARAVPRRVGARGDAQFSIGMKSCVRHFDESVTTPGSVQ